ncbi:hypothetical protein ACLAI9_07820 [Klebsiella pneumoniae]|uniref:hypothetical protein n=1 Tax=Klebsiella pneumoniae TaxID=573 RepID=UPI0007CC36C7|nr:hypothetical protein [Klebsiella pneumoniae]EIX9113235.1 hypothetical protein [Klebsiella pneumoniae]EJD3763834.1 hypothetical protein [Klebsiella pneumoniae]EJG9787917.1 hypothetical protein [Klebsiella pneumoniae]EKU6508537.1 hypothetical protein [Klebsiella pneumoniae]MBC5024418.1 hypothetical protein [Klebsiella pneumoniae]
MMNGNEVRALEGLPYKASLMANLITCMLFNKLSQRQLAGLANVPHETVKKMIKQPAHGSLIMWEHLLKTALKYEAEHKEDTK